MDLGREVREACFRSIMADISIIVVLTEVLAFEARLLKGLIQDSHTSHIRGAGIVKVGITGWPRSVDFLSIK